MRMLKATPDDKKYLQICSDIRKGIVTILKANKNAM